MALAWNNPVVELLGQLSVYERFEAMKQLKSGSHLLTRQEFVTLGWLAIVLLLMLLVVVRLSRLKKERLSSDKRFDEYAERLQLSKEERSIVMAVSRCAGVRHKDSIFTAPDAFDKGLKQLMQDVFSVRQNAQERQTFHRIISSVREKLGYVKVDAETGLTHRLGKERTTRQIPVEMTLSICLLHDKSESWMPAQLVQNGEFEMLLVPEQAVSCRPGDLWKVRYAQGAVIWEFEGITMDASQAGLELNHSEQIRYVNRRRFERVKLEQAAKIAPFPIFEQAPCESGMDITFSPAVIQEIAGTGLRITTDLAVSIRQRVLMMFGLGSNRIIRDVGEVRDIREEQDGCSVVVELIGLNTKALNELMQQVRQMTSGLTVSPENTGPQDRYQEVTEWPN